jgi:hypothetical protein
MTADELPSKNERPTRHLGFPPVRAGALYTGGRPVGLLLVIITVVILLR